MFERATRECSTSPTIQMLAPSSAPSRRRSVNTSSSACVGMLVLAVAGVDHARGRPSRDQPGRARVRGADHDRRGVVGGQRLHGVLERLALVDARARRADADDVGAEPLGGELEARARPRRGLVEEVDDRASAERGNLLDLPPETSAKDSARSRIRSIPARSRSSIEIRCFRIGLRRSASSLASTAGPCILGSRRHRCSSGSALGRSSPRRDRRPPPRGRRRAGPVR